MIDSLESYRRKSKFHQYSITYCCFSWSSN